MQGDFSRGILIGFIDSKESTSSFSTISSSEILKLFRKYKPCPVFLESNRQVSWLLLEL